MDPEDSTYFFLTSLLELISRMLLTIMNLKWAIILDGLCSLLFGYELKIGDLYAAITTPGQSVPCTLDFPSSYALLLEQE